ncbi:hypothetical protein ABBQ38_010875 [Trebouxia sp. C0009 RCD-2024]
MLNHINAITGHLVTFLLTSDCKVNVCQSAVVMSTSNLFLVSKTIHHKGLGQELLYEGRLSTLQKPCAGLKGTSDRWGALLTAADYTAGALDSNMCLLCITSSFPLCAHHTTYWSCATLADEGTVHYSTRFCC